MIKYSFVVPAYNEEKGLCIFYETVIKSFDKLDGEFELSFVNDGSRDATKSILGEICKKDKHVKAVHFSRNFGQQAAILCGMEKSSGQAVIVMDADLQDPPAVALAMIEKWKQGYKIVHGKRRSRDKDSAFKRWSAKLFYKYAQKITGLSIPQNVGDFKLYDRQVVDTILALPEHDRLLRVQTSWIGFSQTEVEFDRPARVAGDGHYTFKKMFSLACGGIFPNCTFPLGFAWKTGFFLTCASVIAFITFVILSVVDVYFGGLIAWLFPALGLCTGLILLGQGFANLRLNMIYKEVQNRPKFIVDEEENV